MGVVSARFPAIKVEVEFIALSEYVNNLVAQVSGGDAPDVIGATVTGDMNALPAQGVLSALDAQIKRDKYDLGDFFEPVLKPNTWQGKQVSLPYNWTTMVFFYNEDLFRRVGSKTPYEYWKAGA